MDPKAYSSTDSGVFGTFYDVLQSIEKDALLERLDSVTSGEVERALYKRETRTPEDFLALVSKSALPYLEEMARLSREKTLQRFGRVVNLYVPIYVSNQCTNICTYCGYSFTNPVKRIVLTKEQIQKEIAAVKAMGFEHVVVLTGESPRDAGVEYLKSVWPLFREAFSHVSLEVQPLTTEEYADFVQMGLDGVYVYQETYDEEVYKTYHLKGKKSHFRHRLETTDRLGQAGVRKIGLGALLGLGDFRLENVLMAHHAKYLQRRYWQSKIAVAFPRIKPAAHVDEGFNYVGDGELVQLVCAWRLFMEDADLSLSTRETPSFRDHVFPLGFNVMSCASKTSPGAYACFKEGELKQFEIDDNRSLEEFRRMLSERGYEGVTKDWYQHA